MELTDDRTTLVCLFHTHDQATAALRDLLQTGIPESAIQVIGGDGKGVDALDKTDLASLGLLDNDYDRLKEGLRGGGSVVAVFSINKQADAVEKIFEKHDASLIDDVETEVKYIMNPNTAGAAPNSGLTPIVPATADQVLSDASAMQPGTVRWYRATPLSSEDDDLDVDPTPGNRTL